MARTKLSEIENLQWSRLRKARRYQRATRRVACNKIVTDIQHNALDGIFIDLNENNASKSYQVQKRILRRIVEKKCAQAASKSTKHYSPRFQESTSRTYIKHCMCQIDSIRKAA